MNKIKTLAHNGKLICIFAQYGVFKYRIGHWNIGNTDFDKAFRTEEEAETFAKLEADAILVWSDVLSERAEEAAREEETNKAARMRE